MVVVDLLVVGDVVEWFGWDVCFLVLCECG